MDALSVSGHRRVDDPPVATDVPRDEGDRPMTSDPHPSTPGFLAAAHSLRPPSPLQDVGPRWTRDRSSVAVRTPNEIPPTNRHASGLHRRRTIAVRHWWPPLPELPVSYDPGAVASLPPGRIGGLQVHRLLAIDPGRHRPGSLARSSALSLAVDRPLVGHPIAVGPHPADSSSARSRHGGRRRHHHGCSNSDRSRPRYSSPGRARVLYRYPGPASPGQSHPALTPADLRCGVFQMTSGRADQGDLNDRPSADCRSHGSLPIPHSTRSSPEPKRDEGPAAQATGPSYW
jgi:hypothetical protein